jgi:drug/metabolite transporter (DMT)-like permease
LGYKFTKYVWIGVALIIGGYLFTVGQNLYDLGEQAGVSLFLQIAIPTILTGAGFALIVYDFWNRYNKRKDRYEPKDRR